MSRIPDAEKKAKIIQTSVEFFGKKGYRTTTIKEISDKVGIAPGSIYTYFKDKNELFRAAIAELWKQFFRKIVQTTGNTTDPFEEKFMGLLYQGLELLKNSRALLVSMFQMSSRKKQLQEHLQRSAELLVNLFEQGAVYGYFPRGITKDHRIFQIKNMLSGVFFQLALASEEDYISAIDGIYEGVRREFFLVEPSQPSLEPQERKNRE
jgi:AcrR family transcriptional regulator